MEIEGRARKYTTEFTLVLTVAAAYLMRAQDMRLVEANTLDASAEVACHLYVISRAPRVSIDPATVEIRSETITVEVSYRVQGKTFKHKIEAPNQLGPDVVWQSIWPFETFEILDSAGTRVSGGVCALLLAWIRDWPAEARLHEILYVGQAFGSAGERTAWDRLKKHETLQRILGEQAPDAQVWLTLAGISDLQLFQEIVPGSALKSDEEDNDHIRTVFELFHGEGFAEREAVALAEAGLIRGWQPEYNDRLKYNFPARKQVALETARGLDLHGLVVEWQSEEIPVDYLSKTGGPDKMFFFGYEVHLDVDRSSTMALEAIDPSTLLRRALPGV